ncbi:MAG: YihY/virulence factor BrkB family protein [Thermoanaerobaculia bacterium]
MHRVVIDLALFRMDGDSMMRLSWQVLKRSVARFSAADAPTHSAALSYSMVFSLPPMLLIVLWAAGVFYEEALVREAVFSKFGGLVGEEGARQVMATLERIEFRRPGWWATAVAAITLLLTAFTVMVSGQKALNRIFRVESDQPANLGLWRFVRDRVVSFAMLVTLAFILSVSLILGTLVNHLGTWLGNWIGPLSGWVTALDSALLDLGAMTLLFAMLFRYLPDIQLPWKETWLGALLTAALFAVGKSLIGLLIGRSEIASLYDAAGSVLVLMLWVYYAAAIFLFGASITAVRAEMSETAAGAVKAEFSAGIRAGGE